MALAPTFRTPEELVVPFELAPTTPEARAFLLACVARVTAGTDVLLHPAVYLAAVLFGAGWLRVRPRGRKALRLLIARDVEIAVQAWTRAKFNDEGAALLYSLANPRQRTEGEARRFAGRVVRRQRQTWWNRPRMPKDYRWPDSFAGFQGALVMAVRAWPSIPLCCWTHHMLAHSDFPKWTFWKSPGRYANFIVGMAGIQTLHMRPRSAEGIFGNLIEQRLHNANGTVLFEESVPLYRVLAARLSTNGGAV